MPFEVARESTRSSAVSGPVSGNSRVPWPTTTGTMGVGEFRPPAWAAREAMKLRVPAGAHAHHAELDVSGRRGGMVSTLIGGESDHLDPGSARQIPQEGPGPWLPEPRYQRLATAPMRCRATDWESPGPVPAFGKRRVSNRLQSQQSKAMARPSPTSPRASGASSMWTGQPGPLRLRWSAGSRGPSHRIRPQRCSAGGPGQTRWRRTGTVPRCRHGCSAA
jgi:hypothetical protein